MAVDEMIPNADQAVIEPEKLYGYLLSRAHPIGKFKARFFNAIGYWSDSWKRLEADLRTQHLSKTARLAGSTRYGQKYEIRAILQGPIGRPALVVSVWVIPAGEDRPRLITAYPGDPK